MFNPYVNNMFPYPSNSPQPIEIPHVNGQSAAQAYSMPPNSSILLLDDNAPIVYLVRTDSACYKTIKPYSITEYTPKPEVNLESLLERVTALERYVANESNNKPAKHDEPNTATSRPVQSVNEYNQSKC